MSNIINISVFLFAVFCCFKYLINITGEKKTSNKMIFIRMENNTEESEALIGMGGGKSVYCAVF